MKAYILYFVFAIIFSLNTCVVFSSEFKCCDKHPIDSKLACDKGYGDLALMIADELPGQSKKKCRKNSFFNIIGPDNKIISTRFRKPDDCFVVGGLEEVKGTIEHVQKVLEKQKENYKLSKTTQEDIWNLIAENKIEEARKIQKDLVEYLRTGKIVKIEQVGKGKSSKHKDADASNYITYENGIKAIRKKNKPPTNVDAEEIGFKTSEMIGLHTVPTTVVVKNEKEERFSIQVFVDAQEITDAALISDVPDDVLRATHDTLFFDVLIDNGDRHGENFLVSRKKIGGKYRQILIDNGMALGASDKWGGWTFFKDINDVEKYVPSKSVWEKFDKLENDKLLEVFSSAENRKEKHQNKMKERIIKLKSKIREYLQENSKGPTHWQK
jgi:hypothetical protein